MLFSFIFMCYTSNIIYVTMVTHMAVIEKPVLPPLKAVLSGKNYHICTFKNEWIDGKCVPIKGSTKTVGKIIGGPTGLINWTDEFLKEHQDLEQFDAFRIVDEKAKKGKLKKYKIDYKPADPLITLTQATTLKRLNAGATWVFDNIIAGSPFAIALHRTFSKYYRDKKLLSIAYYMYLEQSGVMYDYYNFSQKTRLPWGGKFSITRLFQSITEDEINRFILTLSNLVQDEEEKSDKKENIYYALDSTSISTYSKYLPLAHRGFNKDHDNLKQDNVLFLVDQSRFMPVYYKNYDGDIPDVSTVSFVLKEFLRLGLNRKAIIVSDRGYSSICNIHRFFQSDIRFLLNLKTGLTVCKHYISSVYSTLTNTENYKPEINSYVYTSVVTWSYPVNYATNCEKRVPHERKPMYVHIYLNTDIKHEQDMRDITYLATLLSKVNSGLELTSEEIKLKDKFIITDEDELGNKSYRINNQAQAEILITNGIRILVSDDVSDAMEADRAYRERNTVEECFKIFKQDAGGRRHYSSNHDAAHGKTFVTFLATSIASMFRAYIEKCKFMGHKIPASCDREMIRELNRIEQTVFKLGAYYGPITGKRLNLLQSLDIPLPEAEPYNAKANKLDDFEFAEEVKDIKETLRTEEQVMGELLE